MKSGVVDTGRKRGKTMGELLDPQKMSVEDFMGAKAPQKLIPKFQRPFAWDEEQADEFLQDIGRAMERDEPLYFIGALLCVKRGEGKKESHEIVDGQQRLITLSLIFAAAQHLIKDADPAMVKKQMGISADKFMDRVSTFLYRGGGMFDDDDALTDRPYLVEPSENDRMAFCQIVKSGPSSSGNKNRELVAVYNTAKRFFADRAMGTTAGYRYVKDYVKYLTEKVVLVGIFISDEANAYEIFEVLNARGMELAVIDLIKNKLLSCFGTDDDRVNNAYKNWQTALAGCRKRPDKMREYIRCHLQMHKGGKIDPKHLYAEIRDRLEGTGTPEKLAAEILHNLQHHCHKFSAMLCETDRFWEEDFDAPIGPVVGYLNDYRVVYTIMFGMLYGEDKPADFIYRAFRILQTFMKRSRAVRERFSVMEQYEENFAGLARAFYKGKGPKNLKDFFREIKRIDADNLVVIPDESFVKQVGDRVRIKDAEARNMLLELANYVQKRENTDVLVDNDITLEHVFPRNPNREEWPKFKDADADPLVLNRLGNLTLLGKVRNASASNSKFADKKRVAYAPNKCSILLTNELCDYKEWSPETIRSRQLALAELAAEVWAFESTK